jgi:hypothetical protein
MKINKDLMNKVLLFLTIILSILICKFLINFVLYEDIISQRHVKSNLHEDGYVIFKDVLNVKEIQYVTDLCSKDQNKEVKHYLTQHKNNLKNIKKHTNKEYIFQDYIFIIKKSTIHTCHRDSNGDFFNENQKHPSYTLLIFLEDMDKCLGVIPKSHHDINSFNYNPEDQVVNLLCKKGDAILFNANLIHVGALNYKDNNLRIQMKVTHKDDIEAIPYYNNYNKILDQENNMPFFLRKAQRKLSCMFPIIADATQSEVQRNASGHDTSIAQRIFSYVFYGNSNFYKLPNAY